MPVYLVCDLFGKLISYQGIAALCDMLSVSLAGADRDDCFCEVSFFHLMCRHFHNSFIII